jgi:hypothetical protein
MCVTNPAIYTYRPITWRESRWAGGGASQVNAAISPRRPLDPRRGRISDRAPTLPLLIRPARIPCGRPRTEGRWYQQAVAAVGSRGSRRAASIMILLILALEGGCRRATTNPLPPAALHAVGCSRYPSSSTCRGRRSASIAMRADRPKPPFKHAKGSLTACSVLPSCGLTTVASSEEPGLVQWRASNASGI